MPTLGGAFCAKNGWGRLGPPPRRVSHAAEEGVATTVSEGYARRRVPRIEGPTDQTAQLPAGGHEAAGSRRGSLAGNAAHTLGRWTRSIARTCVPPAREQHQSHEQRPSVES